MNWIILILQLYSWTSVFVFLLSWSLRMFHVWVWSPPPSMQTQRILGNRAVLCTFLISFKEATQLLHTNVLNITTRTTSCYLGSTDGSMFNPHEHDHWDNAFLIIVLVFSCILIEIIDKNCCYCQCKIYNIQMMTRAWSCFEAMMSTFLYFL